MSDVLKNIESPLHYCLTKHSKTFIFLRESSAKTSFNCILPRGRGQQKIQYIIQLTNSFAPTITFLLNVFVPSTAGFVCIVC